MKRLKILIFEPYVFNVYGNTRYLISIFRFLDRSRFEPLLVAPIQSEFLSQIRDLGGRCLVAPPPRRLNQHGGKLIEHGLIGRAATMFSILVYSLKFMSLISTEKPDVLHCNSIRALLTVGLAARFMRTPCLWYVKGELCNTVLDRLGFRLADRVLFQCQTTKTKRYPLLIARLSHKISVLHNGIDLEEVEEAQRKDASTLRVELGLSNGHVNAVYVGQIAPSKGLEYLIRAIPKVLGKVPHFKLFLVGDESVPEYRYHVADLHQRVESLHLKDNVTFLGYRTDVLEVVSLMDLFVLPSLSEGVPKSIMEAMALGKPVLATDVGGVKELVAEKQTGFIVMPRDVEGLATALLTLAKDRGIRDRFGAAARRIAQSKFSIRSNISGLEELYRDLAHERQ